ncbi:unnamed protein product, partial [Ranitomeya imitator]
MVGHVLQSVQSVAPLSLPLLQYAWNADEEFLFKAMMVFTMRAHVDNAIHCGLNVEKSSFMDFKCFDLQRDSKSVLLVCGYIPIKHLRTSTKRRSEECYKVDAEYIT